MPRALVAGSFSAPPVRLHVYHNVGKFMICGANGGGCWSDPGGRILLDTRDEAEAVLHAHGYTLDDENVITPRNPENPHTPPAGGTDAAPSTSSPETAVEDADGNADAGKGGEGEGTLEEGGEAAAEEDGDGAEGDSSARSEGGEGGAVRHEEAPEEKPPTPAPGAAPAKRAAPTKHTAKGKRGRR